VVAVMMMEDHHDANQGDSPTQLSPLGGLTNLFE